MRYLLAIVLIAIGVTAVIYGEADDSPGLQLLGGVLVLSAVALRVRAALRTR